MAQADSDKLLSKETTPSVSSINTDEPVRTISSRQNVFAGRTFVVICILFCELCERLTYYSISGNLVLYCTSELDLTSDTAAVVALVFSGTAFFSPLFGGWFADSIAGKFNTIYGGLLIYLLGATLLPIISIEFTSFNPGLYLSDTAKQGYFIFALISIAVGTGGIKANVGPFGAVQLKDADETSLQTFFNWFYWFINVGSTLAFSVGVYVQQTYGFALGYTIPAVSLFAAVVLLLCGRAWYIMKIPEGGPMTTVVNVATATTFRCQNMDVAKTSHGGKYPDQTVEDVKSLANILPIFATVIFYWTCNFQTQTSFLLQGERMKLEYGGFSVPVASLNLFNAIAILLLIPLVDRIIYPLFKKFGMPLSQLHKMGIGMILVAISCIVAGVVEISRKNIMREGYWQLQTLAGETFNASDISVFVQIPQFALTGASEVFTSISGGKLYTLYTLAPRQDILEEILHELGAVPQSQVTSSPAKSRYTNFGIEFAYSQSPSYMQGIVMGLSLATVGLGNYVGSLYLKIVNSITKAAGAQWFPNEINHGYLEYYFFLLAGLMIANFVIFVIVAKNYKYVKHEDQEAGRET